MQRSIHYENLETKIYSGSDVLITFQPKDKIELRRGIEEGKHVVSLVAPWGNIYKLGTYDDEITAQKEFKKYDNYIQKGYSINITSLHTIQMIPPSK